MAQAVTSLYIHIPFCISKCAYCDFFSIPQGKTVPDAYINALCNEIQYRINLLNIKHLKTIYIGGGTPSLLSKNQFVKIFKTLKENSVLLSETEITVEVNPDDVTPDLLEALESCGVNRLSCGIQSLNEKALKNACRRASSKTCKNALSLIQKLWKGQLSVDLISGLPGESEKSLFDTIKEVIFYRPSHISLYSLTIEENTPFGKQLASGHLLYDFDAADRLWLKGRDFLETHGYKWYEVSNFCSPGMECKHNLVYWTHKSYCGCGSGACGTVYYEGGEGFRWTNTSDIKQYTEFWNQTDNPENKDLPQTSEKLDKKISEFEFFMMGLRKLEGVCEEDFINIFGEAFSKRFAKLFSEWEKKGLCEIQNNAGKKMYAMSREGMLFLNKFNMELL